MKFQNNMLGYYTALLIILSLNMATTNDGEILFIFFVVVTSYKY